jgi:hypothetical protein
MGGAALVLAGVALTRVQPRKVVSVNV